MRHILVKMLMLGTITFACFLAGCGQNDTQAVNEENNAVDATGTPEAAVVTATPIAMESGENQTPSGMQVEPKLQKYQVTQGANIRADADGSSEWKGSLFGGEIVQGTGVCENGWIQIRYNGESCYVTGGCLTETDSTDTVTAGDGTPVPQTTTPEFTETPEPTEVPRVTVAPESAVDVSDWAKFTSSKWEASSTTSCYMQIHSVAGNTVIFRFQVIDGGLENAEDPSTLTAEVENCTGKIVNGVLNFEFTDNQGNVGVGSMEIRDGDNLHLATVITQPNAQAAYRAEIMTDLTEIE